MTLPAKRQQHPAAFQAPGARAALPGDQTVPELASPFGVHPTLLHAWKQQRLAGADQVFRHGAQAAVRAAQAQKAERLEPLGRLQREREWLPKTGGPLA